MAEKACKRCKRIITGNECPECSSKEFSDSWKGRIIILNPEQSEIAQKIKINKAGEYAIRL